MAGLILALALAAQPVPPAQVPTAQAAPAKVHAYHDVVISPKGDRVAALEADDSADSEAEPHWLVVVRNRADGKVLAEFDPCASCFYGAPTWSADGRALAFVSSGQTARA